ncbi:MAG TPA: serine hydrolase domain-containing protein [Pyrinomonadaceae bacterium]|nr:serine hydrolase domain-containing protein [Pyrinomonadaceae bacterium]
MISRRALLRNAFNAGVGLVVFSQFPEGRPILAASANSQRTAERFQPAYQRLDAFIARHMHETGAPGMTVALADRNGLLRTSQYGFADLKAGVKVGPQTLFEIGSISKSFVAIAILSLADEGKIDLHKPVIEYLPWLKIESKYAPFTTHHLLTHTAGLSAVPLLMRVAATTLTTGWEPGSRFLYSNIGYVLLGFLLEAIDRRSFPEVLHKRVLEPLGMTASAPVITNAIKERLAIGYGPLHEDRPFPLRGKLAEAPWLEVPEAAGSVAATAGDMVAYLQLLLNRGAGPRGRVISEKSFQLLVKPVIKAAFRGEDASYGYGLWTSDGSNRTLVRHTGGMVAFSSAMYADLTDGFAAFASVNANLRGYRPVAVTRYALDLLNAASRNQELPALPASQPTPDSIKNAADYAGTFNAPDGKKLVLIAQGDKLILQHGGQRIVLEQAGRDRFIVKHPDYDLFTLSFGRDKDVVVEAFHGTGWWANERYSGPKFFEYPKEWDTLTGRYRSDSPWYGSSRLFVRKGRLILDDQQFLIPLEPGVFRPQGDINAAERITFDTLVNGKAMHLNFSGIDFYRTFTS